MKRSVGTEKRLCAWCRVSIDVTARRDAKYCSQRCRQAAHRFGKDAKARKRASEPMLFAYADPPYPGLSGYYKNHDDYAGEVDHKKLLSDLEKYDGWALSTSMTALPKILSLCVASGSSIRVAAWFRGSRKTKSRLPLSSWEPVVFSSSRRLVSNDKPDDSLIYISRPRTTDVDRVIGAKPAKFAYWMFDLLGALPGDGLDDLFPGSGGIRRAWAVYMSREYSGDASCGQGGDVSASPGGDTSAHPGGDTSYPDLSDEYHL